MRCRATIAALSLAAALTLFVSPALAHPKRPKVECGKPITHSVKLTDDLHCTGDGLIIGADGITVDLNGHEIAGSVTQAGCPDVPGVRPSSAGISNPGGWDGVTIKDGTVRQFDEGIGAGSFTEGMSDSRVRHVTLSDNRFAGVSLGSGAGAAATANNRIDHNVVSGNGCAGIDLNTGQANRFANNQVQDTGGTAITVCCGDETDGNVVEDNEVSGTGDAGISVFASGGVRLEGNVLSDIGRDGIDIVGPSSNAVVEDNTITRARWSGIFVASCCGPVTTDVRIEDNALSSTGEGIILIDTDRDVVRRNSVTGAGTFGAAEAIGVGIFLDGVSDTHVSRNAVADGRAQGIVIGVGPPLEFPPSDRPVTGNVVERNAVSGHVADGIFVADRARSTTVQRNTAEHNGADGIHVLSPDPLTTITRNEASHNAAYGIEAHEAVTDGGGNEAEHNGNSAQCTGVACH